MLIFYFVAVIHVVCNLHIQAIDSNFSEICLPTWNKMDNLYSMGAIFVGIMPLGECLIHCESKVGCLAVDYTKTESLCWVHSDPTYESKRSDDQDVSQYSLNKNCSSLEISNEECQYSWKSLPNKWSNSDHTEVGLANFSSCFNYCRFTSSCSGFIFDNSSWPFCMIFSNVTFTDPAYLEIKPSSAIYFFDKNQCANSSYRKSYVRCSGHTFPQISQWCPAENNIIIGSMQLKNHPECCEDSVQRQIPPLDNDQLLAINVNKSYGEFILKCISNSSCVLRAEGMHIDLLSNVCSSKTEALNSVVITFTCSGFQNETTTVLPPIKSSYFPSYTLPPTIQFIPSIASSNTESLTDFTQTISLSKQSDNFPPPTSFSASPTIKTFHDNSTTSIPVILESLTDLPQTISLSKQSDNFSPSSFFSASPTIKTLPHTNQFIPSIASSNTESLTDFPQTISLSKQSDNFPTSSSFSASPTIKTFYDNSTTSIPVILESNLTILPNQPKERTGLVLGAIATTLSLFCLILLVFFLVIYSKSLCGKGMPLDNIWNTMTPGSSKV